MSDTSDIGQAVNGKVTTTDLCRVTFLPPVADRLVSALAPQVGERCLDVGCGSGEVSRLLAERVGHQGDVLGIDGSADLVSRASAEVHGARFEVGDTVSPGPADAGWDLIASAGSLSALDDPVAALAAWRSRLRRRGRLGVATFGPSHETEVAVGGLEDLFRAAGFIEVRTACTTELGGEAGPLDVRVTTGRQRL
jgi:ubiquinone/menaquinone biosynthesis C-methylase UbiE